MKFMIEFWQIGRHIIIIHFDRNAKIAINYIYGTI